MGVSGGLAPTDREETGNCGSGLGGLSLLLRFVSVISDADGYRACLALALAVPTATEHALDLP